MRLFIGINIPKKERLRVHRAVRTIRDAEFPVRWVDPDNFHVTLKFLGEVRRELVPTIETALEHVAGGTRPFNTALSGFGAFPTIRRPHVIWLGAGASPEFRCLKQDLEWALGDVGFDAETRAFHPHLTLGRADESGGAGLFRGLDTLLAEMDFSAEIKVRTLDLMRSKVSREGARYSVVSSWKLTAK